MRARVQAGQEHLTELSDVQFDAGGYPDQISQIFWLHDIDGTNRLPRNPGIVRSDQDLQKWPQSIIAVTEAAKWLPVHLALQLRIGLSSLFQQKTSLAVFAVSEAMEGFDVQTGVIRYLLWQTGNPVTEKHVAARRLAL